MMFIKSPREKNKLNFYLNDNNLYVKNSLKLREKHLSYFKEKIKEKNDLKKKFPVPRILYSTSDLNYHERQNNIVDKFSPKNAIKDLVDVVNSFTDNLNFDDEDDDEKTEKHNTLSVDEKKSIKDIKLNILNNNKNNELFTNEKKNKYKEFFLTGKNILDEKVRIKSNAKSDLLNDLEFAKAKNTNEAIISKKELKKINEKNKMFKTNLYFENYGKFKFTKKGLYFPNSLSKYELPNYTGDSEEEKKYFNFRKKIANPEVEYNKISSFSEKLNRDLKIINNNYGKTLSRPRFTENPLTKKYMEIMPTYEIYKDLKQIENRYIGSRYKFRLLPLYNKRLSNLDKLADKFYKNQSTKEGLANLLHIQNKNYFNHSNIIN